MVALFLLFQRGGAPSPPPVVSLAVSPAPIEIYFTGAGSPAAESFRGGPDAMLAQAIDAAAQTVDVAVYDLNLWSLRDALIRAAGRGVRVRLVTDSDNILEPEVTALAQAGIPVLGDRRDPLMHHKFTVIDGIEVWTGSMNYTVSDGYLNDNNLVRLRSADLAESYTREFEEMFLEDRFGALSLPDTPHREATVGEARVEVYFSPDDDAARRIEELILSAQESVDFLAFSFTLDSLRQALLDRAAEGIRVRGVIEAAQAESGGSILSDLQAAGVDVRLDGNPHNMHHKVIVIDGSVVITGSYNFSASAEETNDENVLILHSQEAASLFLIEFERVFGLAAP
jgi:phosphatidylserine/phosphatidylglycerophosphate/cardiolipin synthase-like enzyme